MKHLRSVPDAVRYARHHSGMNRAFPSCIILITPFSLTSSFFTTAIRSDAAVSSHAVKQRIRSLIQAEDPAAPLSDEALRLALSALGVDVSRRVIAKYRAELNIPSSSQRKKR